MQNELQRMFVETVERKYNIKIIKLSSVRGSIIIETCKEKYIAKKINVTQEKWAFVNLLKEHLACNGFPCTDRYLTPSDGEGIFRVGEDCWTICTYNGGRESNFDEKPELEQICKSVARMHKATRNFKPKEIINVREELGKTPLTYNKRLDELKRLKKKAEKGHSQFDMLFLKTCGYFIESGQEAVKLINGNSYDAVIKTAIRKQETCHCDLTYQNILVDKRGTYIINFECAAFDTKIYDITNLIRRKMRKCNWAPKEAEKMILDYHSINELTYDDIIVLKAMLMFPQKYWRIANKHYNMKRAWAEKGMVNKLQEAVNEQQAHADFIKAFN